MAVQIQEWKSALQKLKDERLLWLFSYEKNRGPNGPEIAHLDKANHNMLHYAMAAILVTRSDCLQQFRIRCSLKSLRTAAMAVFLDIGTE